MRVSDEFYGELAELAELNKMSVAGQARMLIAGALRLADKAFMAQDAPPRVLRDRGPADSQYDARSGVDQYMRDRGAGSAQPTTLLDGAVAPDLSLLGKAPDDQVRVFQQGRPKPTGSQ